MNGWTVHRPAPVPVVIVNYNRADWTIKCLRSLGKIEQPTVRAIVVDNASTDDSAERIRRSSPGTEVIVASANRGFGAGSNIGIRAALRSDADYVWLLNNDTEVAPNCLRLLVDKAEADPRVGVVGAMIYEFEERERVQVAGGGYVFQPLALTRHRHSTKKSLDFVTGVSMLVRREPLELVGGFDERLFLYCEDVDLCVRIVAAGWHLAFQPAARVWHHGGATTSARGSRRPTSIDRIFAASTAVFIRKHAGRLWPVWLGVRVMLMFVRRLTPRRAASLRAMLRGISDGLVTF